MTPLSLPGPLVSVDWLQAHLADVIVLDASLAAPVTGGGGPATVAIPGAQVFDYDKSICDRSSPLPHMMPPAGQFVAAAQALGIGRDSVVVVYDRVGTYASPRAWWMFRAMGHTAVAVLNGGLPAWLRAGLPTGPFAPTRPPGDFVQRPAMPAFCDADAVAAALDDPTVVVLDARSPGRFAGREPEPRAGLRLGHMPGAVNLFFGDVQEGGAMRPLAELQARLAAAVGGRRRLVLSCGSGVTACIVGLAATMAGYTDLIVYDGSWSEWGLPSARPVVTDGP